MISADEYARMHGVHKNYVRRMAQQGILQAEKIGNQWVIYDAKNALPSATGKRITQRRLVDLSNFLSGNKDNIEHGRDLSECKRLANQLSQDTKKYLQSWRYRDGVKIEKFAANQHVADMLRDKYAANITGVAYEDSGISCDVVDLYVPTSDYDDVHRYFYLQRDDVKNCNVVLRFVDEVPEINLALVAFDLMNDHSSRSHNQALSIMGQLL